ncbi:MAG: acyltransferase [Casimicrobiaceae bacterium]
MTLHTQRADYIPALTGLRGLAAAAVVCFHIWNFAGGRTLDLMGYPLHAIPACGYLGVDLFFVLSAFLLAQPFLAAADDRRGWPALRTYFLRRGLRVVPALWSQIAILFAVGWMMGRTPPFDARTALAYMFFMQNVVAHPGTINAVYWSLPVEWWFYFWIPVIAWLFGRTRWWWLLALFLVSGVAFRVACWQWHNEAQWDKYANILLLRARVDEFFLGILAAWAHLHFQRDSPWRAFAAAIGALGLLALLPSLAERGDIFARADYPWLLVHYTIVGSLLALIAFGVAGTARWVITLAGNRIVLWLGMISYSLYLWHFPVLQWTDKLGLWRNFAPLTATMISLAAMLVTAAVSYRFIERPFLHR